MTPGPAPNDMPIPGPSSFFSRMGLFALIIAIIVLSIRLNSEKREKEHYKDLANKTELNFTKYRDHAGRTFASQDAEKMSLRQALNAERVEKEKYMARLLSQIHYSAVTSIDTIFIPYALAPEIRYIDRPDSSGLHDTFIKVPLPFQSNTLWYAIKGRVKSNGIVVDSLKVYNKFRATVFYKKRGFLKRRKLTVEIKSDNPYTDITAMDNVVIEDKAKKRLKQGLGLSILANIITFAILKSN